MPIPNIGSVPDVVTNTLIPTDWGNAIGASSRGRVVQRFNTAAERDASITAPIAGMVCYLLSTDTLYYYRQTGGWTAVPQQSNLYGRAYRNAGFTPATGTALQLDTANYDPSGAFNPTPGKFTCAASGIYQVAGAMSVSSAAAGNIFVAALTKNGTSTTSSALANATAAGQTLTAAFADLVQCATGDVLALSSAYNPFTLVGVGGTSVTYLAVQYLHP